MAKIEGIFVDLTIWLNDSGHWRIFKCQIFRKVEFIYLTKITVAIHLNDPEI